MIQQPRSTGNLVLGIIGGIIAAIVAAILWGAITAATQFEIGYMAIGVGFLVAFAMRFAGRGHDTRFMWAAAIISLAGCVLGNYIAACAMFANAHHANPVSVTVDLLPHFTDVIQTTFSAMDLFFYAIGAYFGYKYAATPLAPRATAPVAAEEQA